MMSKVKESQILIESVADKTEECILFCSLGKDSLVLLDLIYPRFKRIVCVFMYFIKGLEHIQRYIDWVKMKYPRVEFVQVPHWNLSYILRSGLYCVPNPNVKLIKLTDVTEAMKLRFGIHYVFLGMKKADSMNRRLMLNGYKDYENNGLAYPLADWTQKEILTYMRHHKLPEPIRYSKKASGGVGFNEECFVWLRENFPEDLEKIFKTFPMSRKILFDYDNKQIHQE